MEKRNARPRGIGMGGEGMVTLHGRQGWTPSRHKAVTDIDWSPHRKTGIRRYSRVPLSSPTFRSGAKPHRTPPHLPEALG